MQAISINQALTDSVPLPFGASGVGYPQLGGSSETDRVLSILSAADELAGCREPDSMLRLAIELARERLGLERVGIFMRDRAVDRVIMRGTWGTGARGETTDEHSLFHEVAPQEYNALSSLRQSGGLGMYRAKALWFAAEPGRGSVVIGEGWVVTTPLVVAGDVVGVMYNDCALTQGPMDPGKQATAAIFCTLLAMLYLPKRGRGAWQALSRQSGHSSLVEQILKALGDQLPVTGEQLADELGVSPGHLARSFKQEMGVSLVDYRNRLRIDRFFEAIHRSGRTGNLLAAALEAGFGSYGQFHRVYRKFLGSTPRDLLCSGAPGGLPAARVTGTPPGQAASSSVETGSLPSAHIANFIPQ